MTGPIRFLILLAGWLALSIGPFFAPESWDSHYHVFQALTALCIIGITRKLFRNWWSNDLCAVCTLQILHAVGDYLWFNETPYIYNLIQAGLNAMELALLLIGGISELVYGRRNTRRDGDSGRDSGGRTQGKSHA